MSCESVDVIGRAVGRAPEWIKQELSAKDPPLRQRAEEALAAMIAAALEAAHDSSAD